MTLFDTILDATEISISCAYAAWLREHKEYEPHMTWAEVAFGTAYTLLFAHLRGWVHNDDWRAQSARTVREFFISGPPIIIGELIQKLEERRDAQKIDEEFPR